MITAGLGELAPPVRSMTQVTVADQVRVHLTDVLGRGVIDGTRVVLCCARHTTTCGDVLFDGRCAAPRTRPSRDP